MKAFTVRRRAWKRLAQAEHRIADLAAGLTDREAIERVLMRDAKLAHDDVLRAAVLARITEITERAVAHPPRIDGAQ